MPAAGGAGAACTLRLGLLAGGASGSRAFAVRADNPLPPGVERIANAACLTIETIEAAPATPHRSSPFRSSAPAPRSPSPSG